MSSDCLEGKDVIELPTGFSQRLYERILSEGRMTNGKAGL